MARLIEFQGKTFATGQWITGNLCIANSVYNSFELPYFYGVFIECKLDAITLVKCLVIPETVGQYTNVIGSDGCKIYDHDIVSDGNSEGEVYWNYDYNGWRIAVADQNDKLIDIKLTNTYKVVGHKYDRLIQTNSKVNSKAVSQSNSQSNSEFNTQPHHAHTAQLQGVNL